MFKFYGSNPKITNCVALANDNSNWDFLEDEIKLKDSFDMSTLSPQLVYEDIRAFWEEKDITVKIYYPKWRLSKAIGYFTPSRPLDINLNGYKLNRSQYSIIGTFFHELVHLSDNHNKNQSYGHGDNNPLGKQNTAPYFIGNVFTNLNNTENSDYKKYVPWWSKLWKWIF